MTVAVIHDVFIESGGAERVLISLLRMYPSADVFVPLLTPENKTLLEGLTTGKVYTTVLNRVPFVHSASVFLKPLLYLYWEYLDLASYDIVITSSHSYSSKAVLTSPLTLHVSYVHTPPRYLYTEYNETRIIKKKFFRIALQPMLSWLRSRDFLAAQRPDILVANSSVVQRRIGKYYRRESVVVSPPVQIPKTVKKGPKRKKYFLCHSRLTKQKGIDLAIQACNTLSLPLLVVGRGSEEAYLRSIAGPTVTFAGYVPDNEMAEMYANAHALIYCSIEEDFGLVPVEAMAYGVPVIGYRSGGTAETVIAGKTGVFFDEYSVPSLVAAVQRFKRTTLKAEVCQHHAQQYSEEQFHKKLRSIISRNIPKP